MDDCNIHIFYRIGIHTFKDIALKFNYIEKIKNTRRSYETFNKYLE